MNLAEHIISFPQNLKDNIFRTSFPIVLFVHLFRSSLKDRFGQISFLEAETYSSDVIREVAARGAVGHVLKGGYTKAGDLFRIYVSPQNTQTGEQIGAKSVEGRGVESIFSLVDKLTPKIKEYLNLSVDEIENDYDGYIEHITTHSPEAYRYFRQALEENFKAQFLTSVQLLERAISIDPEFATAYRWVVYAYENIGNNAGSARNLQTAYELRERLPDRDRYGRFSRLLRLEGFDHECRLFRGQRLQAGSRSTGQYLHR